MLRKNVISSRLNIIKLLEQLDLTKYLTLIPLPLDCCGRESSL